MSQLKSEEIQNKIYSIVGYRFSLSSSRQMSRALYGDQKLPVLSKTKTGVGSTSEEALKKLAAKGYEVAALILEYRKAVAEEQKAAESGAADTAVSAGAAEPVTAPSASAQAAPSAEAAPAAEPHPAASDAGAKSVAQAAPEPAEESWKTEDDSQAQAPSSASPEKEDRPNVFTESASSINERSITEPAAAGTGSVQSRKSLLIWGIITGAALALIILVLLLRMNI